MDSDGGSFAPVADLYDWSGSGSVIAHNNAREAK